MNKLGSFKYQYFFFSPKQPFNSDLIIQAIRKHKQGDAYLQVLDPKFIVSEKQIVSALYHTERAFLQKRNIARDYSTEFLLRLSGERQISVAIDLIGIKNNSKTIMLISFGKTREVVNLLLSNFISEISEQLEKIPKIELPISSLTELGLNYNCKENFEIIEKKALEVIAAIELL